MKKVLLFIAILFFFDRFGQAQSLTIEYNIGHGSYQMSDMKDILKNQMLPVTNVQVTDNFPRLCDAGCPCRSRMAAPSCGSSF